MTINFFGFSNVAFIFFIYFTSFWIFHVHIFWILHFRIFCILHCLHLLYFTFSHLLYSTFLHLYIFTFSYLLHFWAFVFFIFPFWVSCTIYSFSGYLIEYIMFLEISSVLINVCRFWLKMGVRCLKPDYHT